MLELWIGTISALAGVVIGGFLTYLNDRRKSRIDGFRAWSDRVRPLCSEMIRLLREMEEFHAAEYLGFDNAKVNRDESEILHDIFALKSQLDLEGTDRLNQVVQSAVRVASGLVYNPEEVTFRDLQAVIVEFTVGAKSSLRIPATDAELPKGTL